MRSLADEAPVPRGQVYLVALGSNQRHPHFGSPRAIVQEAFLALDEAGDVLVTSPIVESAPIGPSKRRYANAAAVLESELQPMAMLETLQQIERDFGRSRRGQRWRSRTLDLDIVLWSGGIFGSDRLTIPHPLYRTRPFVLSPAAEIASAWRDPMTGLSLAQLNHRLTRKRPLPSAPSRGRALSSVGRATDF